MSRSWSRLAERGTPFATWLIIWIALHLGRGIARALLYPTTTYFLLRAADQRRASRAFLTRILGRPATFGEVARHIHTFATVILDRVFLLAGRTEGFIVKVHGEEQVAEQLRTGKGCLLLGSHLGSFEVLRLLALRETPFVLKVLMYPAHNQVLTELLHALDKSVAQTVIPLGTPDALLQVKESIDRGEMVGLLGDRVSGSDKTVRCRFLEKDTLFPSGPALLSYVLKAPVILCFALHKRSQQYEVYFEEIAGPPASRDEEALREWTQHYVDRLEYHARNAPYNWFNFYDYWQDNEESSSS